MSQKDIKGENPEIQIEDTEEKQEMANVDIQMMNNQEFKTIRIEDIVENEWETRKAVNMGKFESFKDSIQQNGILVPLLVKRTENNKYMIIAGQRRFLAAKELNLSPIPVRIMDADPLKIGLIENLQREDLHPVDEAESLSLLYDELKNENNDFNQEELGKLVGKKQNTVSEILKICEIIPELREKAKKYFGWTRKQLLKIAENEDPDVQKKVFQSAVQRLRKLESGVSAGQDSLKQGKSEGKVYANAFIKRVDKLEESIKFFDKKKSKIVESDKQNLKTKLETLKKQIEDILTVFDS
jgi:ParB family transcriptional regulator, chromosome partitioning protein